MRGGRLGLQGRLAFVAVALAIAVGLLAVLLIQAIHTSQEQTRRARASADTLRAADRVGSLVLDMETGLRGYQLTRDDSFLDPFRRARLDVPGELDRLRAFVREGSRRREEVDALAERIDAYVGRYAPRLRDDVQRGNPQVAELAREGRRHVDEMRRRLARFRALQEGVQELRRREADRAADRAIVVGAVGSAVAFALVALAALYLGRLLVPALRGLTVAARRIAADDFNVRVRRRGRAELGELEDAFNMMAAQLAGSQAELRRYGETNVAMLEAVFRQSPVGLAFVDSELRFLRVNDTLAQELAGEPAEDLVGRRVDQVVDLLDDPSVHPFEQILRTREAIAGVELPRPTGEGAEARWWQASFYPVVVGDALVAIGVVVVDVTAARRREERRRRELLAERRVAESTARLEALSTALSRALTLQDVARVSVEHLVRGVDAVAGACLLLDEPRGVLEVLHAKGPRRRGERIAADGSGPPAEAVARGRRVVRRTVGDVWEVGLPVVFGDVALGCFELCFPPAEGPSADTLEAAGRMVDRCSQAIARARLFDREHDVAQTLQRSLLPGALPDVDGIEIDARFRPAGLGTLVGGDFYDVIVVDDRRFVLVVGDVCGKGARAAAATQLVRYAIRAEVRVTQSPAALLAQLDAGLTQELYDSDRFVTVGCAFCTVTDGGLDVRLSLAGNPPPLLTKRDGGCQVVGRPGPVVGVGLRRFPEDRVLLAPGEGFVLYTDGLTDAQAPARIDQPGDLCHVLDGRTNGAGSLADRLDALLAHAVGTPDVLPRDDIAILGLRVGRS